MLYSKNLKLFLILVLLLSTSAANAFFKFKNEYHKKHEKVNKSEAVELNIFYISHSNLYLSPPIGKLNAEERYQILKDQLPILDHNKDFTEFSHKLIEKNFHQKPDFNSKIAFNETELLLQENIREVLTSLKERPVDLVLFGGNQVFSNDLTHFFRDISVDLNSFNVAAYELVGPNDLRGNINNEELYQDKFYLLKTKNVNILVLDNVSQKIIPANLPAEATQQYLWLEKVLRDIAIRDEEVMIFSYYPLDTATINFLNQYPKLLLRAVASAEGGNFAKLEAESFIHRPKPLKIRAASLSSYPCSYVNITRNEFGHYDAEEIKVGLKYIQDLARKKL